jgi:hypothetical protein
MAVTFILLPLYEFVDVGEHWAHDGNYAMLTLAILFSIALVVSLRSTASITSRNRFAYEAAEPHFEGGSAGPIRVPLVNAVAILRIASRTVEDRHSVPVGSSSSRSPRFLTLSDFRL